jgi:hypothetical protein
MLRFVNGGFTEQVDSLLCELTDNAAPSLSRN